MNSDQKVTFARDALIATVAVVALYSLGAGVQIQPLQTRRYLLVVGFDVLEAVFGSAGSHFDLLFGAYLVGLGLLGGGAASLLRALARDAPRSVWRLGVAGWLAGAFDPRETRTA